MNILQHAPFCVQVELVEGCTLACSFCAINAIRTKPGGFKYMSAETAERIAGTIAVEEWGARIEFAMHGEPSQHPEADKIIGIFRKHLPKSSIMMTSNGSGFKGRIERIWALRDAGLNVLALDNYDHANFVPAIIKELPEVRYYPQDKGASVHKKRKPNTFEVVVLQDISKADAGNHSHLANHAGQAAPRDRSYNDKRCTKPFRELAFRWDGQVAICCDDFAGRYRIGSIHELSTQEIWQHERFQAARKKLFHYNRGFGTCDGCTALSVRVGLLPDPSGLSWLPEATSNDDRIIAEAMADGPCTLEVKRT